MGRSNMHRRTAACALAAAAMLLAGCSQQWGWYVVNPTTPAGRTNLSFLIGGLQHTVLLVADGDFDLDRRRACHGAAGARVQPIPARNQPDIC